MRKNRNVVTITPNYPTDEQRAEKWQPTAQRGTVAKLHQPHLTSSMLQLPVHKSFTSLERKPRITAALAFFSTTAAAAHRPAKPQWCS